MVVDSNMYGVLVAPILSGFEGATIPKCIVENTPMSDHSTDISVGTGKLSRSPSPSCEPEYETSGESLILAQRTSSASGLARWHNSVVAPLRGIAQHYAWGCPADTALVATMACKASSPDYYSHATPVDSSKLFAELWMGTHPNGHSTVLVQQPKDQVIQICQKGSSKKWRLSPPQTTLFTTMPQMEGEPCKEMLLKDLIAENPQHWLGNEDAARGDLPFLFKVLSVRKALSIQAHPNKTLAKELHQSMPEHYPDSNHKPEICIPTGYFEALCGFRRIGQIREYIRSVEELRALCVKEGDDIEALNLRELYSRLMRSNELDVQHQLNRLIQRLEQKKECNRTAEESLILRLDKEYGADVGIFSVFFLNYVKVSPDMPHSFIYCAPDEPHAYLLGECVECMALSDNVVRAGLTPKFKDVETLLRMMTYRDDLLEELVNTGEKIGPHIVKYDPPVDEFLVYEFDGVVPEGLVLPHASIAACIRGSMVVDFQPCEEEPVSCDPQVIQAGTVMFCRANTRIVIPSCETGSLLFVATY